MIRHIVLICWADGVTEENIQQVCAGFDDLQSAIPLVRNMIYGPDLDLVEGNYDFAMIADFDSVDDWQAYRDHPEHQSFAQSFVPWASAAARIQFEL